MAAALSITALKDGAFRAIQVKLTPSFLWLMFFILVFNVCYDALFFHGILNRLGRAFLVLQGEVKRLLFVE